MAKRSAKSCGRMANDVKRIADLAADLAEGGMTVPGATGGKSGRMKTTGLILGPSGRDVFYRLRCYRKMPRNEFGPGRCGVYEIERSGPGLVRSGLKETATVGNLYGLTKQLSRDLTRLWGCAPEKMVGFDGAGRRRRRRRR